MPKLRSHTHLQAIHTQAQTKACKRVCLPNRTTDRPTDDREEQRSHNRRLAQWRVTWLIEHSTSHQSTLGGSCIDNFVLPFRPAGREIPRERQSQNS